MPKGGGQRGTPTFRNGWLGVQGFFGASNTRPHSEPYAAGTDNQAAETPNGAQYLERRTRRRGAHGKGTPPAQKKSPKPWRVADLDDDVPDDAAECESAPSWTRTKNLLIKSQSATPENPEENAHFENCAAAGAAVGSENGLIDAELQAIIQRWGKLPDAVKAGIVAMVRAAGG